MGKNVNAYLMVDSRYPYSEMLIPALRFVVKLKRFHSMRISVGALSYMSFPRKKMRSVAVAGVSVRTKKKQTNFNKLIDKYSHISA